MFTGIITDTASVAHEARGADGLTLTFTRPKTWTDMVLGESVATNGACLTVAALSEDAYDCLLMPETLAKTSFGRRVPKTVNLERPLSLSARLDGHFVQGHVDCVGTVSAVETTDGYRLFVTFPSEFADLVIPKGSITIDGVSLTVVASQDYTLSVALIPHTLQSTTLKDLQVGDAVNLEFDMIGKYIVNIMLQRETHAKSPAN